MNIFIIFLSIILILIFNLSRLIISDSPAIEDKGFRYTDFGKDIILKRKDKRKDPKFRRERRKDSFIMKMNRKVKKDEIDLISPRDLDPNHNHNIIPLPLEKTNKIINPIIKFHR